MAGVVSLDLAAPDFELTDLAGRPYRLSDRRRSRHVILVFNRGFT